MMTEEIEIYECIESFEVERLDERRNGTGEYMNIEAGSRWEVIAECLDSVMMRKEGSYAWIEIDTDLLNDCFKKSEK
jgi:hypothetical protein